MKSFFSHSYHVYAASHHETVIRDIHLYTNGLRYAVKNRIIIAPIKNGLEGPPHLPLAFKETNVKFYTAAEECTLPLALVDMHEHCFLL